MTDPAEQASWNPDELESVLVCPACGAAPGAYRHEAVHDNLEGVPGRWSLRDCSACGCAFLDPRPTPEAIGKAYASYYTHGSALSAHAQDNGQSLLWKLSNGYLNARYGTHRQPALAAGKAVLPLFFPLRQQLDFFYRHLPTRPGRLLDVGCGSGVFLLRAREAGWQVMGLEPDPLAAESVRKSGLPVHSGTLDTFVSSEPFDVVTASHVIEHVHEPAAFLGQSFSLLRPSGRLWLATPNVQSIGHRHFGGAWRGLEPPRHLTLFSARALASLLRAAGFDDIHFHRRGRGAHYILDQSRKLARRLGQPAGGLPTAWVDLRASLGRLAAEELVVSARKPAV